MSAGDEMPEESKPNPSKRSRDEYQNGQDVEDPLAKAMEADTDDDDDDLGPMPMPAAEERQKATKKRKVLPYAKLYLDDLPSANRYYKSFMHRDTISYIHVTKTNFVISASVDGHVKFWKKRPDGVGIEFVKHFRAHLGPILGSSISADGYVFATVSDDRDQQQTPSKKGSVKVFDVVNFDMINQIPLDYVPKACCWVHQSGQAQALLAISEEDAPVVRIYDGRGDGTPLHVVEKLHSAPIHLMAYNSVDDTVISADTSGMLEYWQPVEPFEQPPDVWQYKSETDLYDFKKSKSTPTSLVFSPSFEHFVTTSIVDRQVRVFNFATGKLHRRYDESLTALQEMQQAGTAIYKLDEMEFGRRLAVERELEKSEQGRTANAIFDRTGNFVIYPTLLGIKVVNMVTNRVARLLGKDETNRFLNVSLFQGLTGKKGIQTMEMAASDNPLLAEKSLRDPTLFCTAFKRPRLYLFSQLEPESDMASKATDRDIFNEKPSREEQTIAAVQPTKQAQLANSATIHTTKGDIHFRLYPDKTPKTVENFVLLAKRGYYDGVIFHRVIKKFMLQTGDPLGDGTGGESAWGGTFEDELVPELKHDRPYTLSMANAGPKTNGSQFFITTVPTPWLDMKHTIFGRADSGMDVIHAIELARTDKSDKPYDDIKIVSIELGS